MCTGLSHIELELARTPEYPFGDRGHLYHLYLPLAPDGRIDMTALRRAGACFRVRSLRDGQAERAGSVELDPDGQLTFRFAQVGNNLELGFRTPPDRFVVGQRVAIAEDDGERRQFDVIAVRRHVNEFGQATSSAAV